MTTSFSNDQGTGYTEADGFILNSNGTLTVAATGSNSQSGAATLNKQFVVVTASVTTRAVRLPNCRLGSQVFIANTGTVACSVFPATGQRIGAAATNVRGSNRVAGNRGNIYRGVSATKWVINVSG